MKKLILLFSTIVLIFACKKQYVEPAGEKLQNDTVIVNPEYWCVKRAILKRPSQNDVHLWFDYDGKSRLKTASAYTIDGQNDTIFKNYIAYTYDGNNLVSVYTKDSSGTVVYEDSRKYASGKLVTKATKGLYYLGLYQYTPANPLTINYGYENNLTTQIILGPGYTSQNDTLTTNAYKDFADSSVAQIDQIKYASTHLPAYTFKERLDKSRNLVLLERGGNTDSVYMTKIVNLIDPVIWEMFDLDYTYYTYTPYWAKSVLLSREHNPFLLDSKRSSDYVWKYSYDFDQKGRISKLNYQVINTPPQIPSSDFGKTVLELYY